MSVVELVRNWEKLNYNQRNAVLREAGIAARRRQRIRLAEASFELDHLLSFDEVTKINRIISSMDYKGMFGKKGYRGNVGRRKRSSGLLHSSGIKMPKFNLRLMI